MTTHPLTCHEYIQECFTYEPLTGILRWKNRPRNHFQTQRTWKTFNNKYVGTIVGHKRFRHGVPTRIVVRVERKLISVTRVIFSLMGLHIPAGMVVDHKNRNPFDNSWNNLRLATIAQNNANSLVRRNKHKNLPKGVIPQGSGFVSQMKHNGRRIYIGLFATPEEAHAAYVAKAKVIHGEFARGE